MANGAKRNVDGLNERQARFAHEYCVDFSPGKAAVRAGYSDTKNVSITACNLLKLPLVKAAIERHKARIAKQLDIDAGSVLAELGRMAFADANDLVQHRVGSCRYCWGVDFKYHETPKEQADRRASHDKGSAKEEPFDEKGGTGYSRTRPPNARCPECHGLGVGYVFAVDSREVRNGARALYAGAKQTKDGIEIKTYSKEFALEKLGQHFGLFKQNAPEPGTPAASVTNNTQNNLYALSRADLERLLREKLAVGNAAPGPGEG